MEYFLSDHNQKKHVTTNCSRYEWSDVFYWFTDLLDSMIFCTHPFICCSPPNIEPKPKPPVTGANQGIGFEIVKQLLLLSGVANNWNIILCSRDAHRGEQALKQLGSPPNVHLAVLDVTDQQSIDHCLCVRLKQELKIERIDVLINNAGFATKGPEINRDIAQQTVAVNYFGAKNLIDSCLEQGLITIDTETDSDSGKEPCRIIIVSSQVSVLSHGDEKRIQCFKPLLLSDDNNSENDHAMISSIDQVDQLVQEFITDCENEHVVAERGWPKSTYRMSKIAINAYGKLLANRFKQQGKDKAHPSITVNMCCPGWCSTRMGGAHASRTPEQGARVAVWLATSDEVKDVTGKFFFETREISF